MGGINPETALIADPALRNRAASAMREKLALIDENKPGEYKQCKTNEQRSEWLCEYLIEPKQGGWLGKKFTSREDIVDQNENDELLTLEQLASPMYLNSMDHAKAYIKGKKGIEHDDPNMVVEGKRVLTYK